MLRLVKKFGLEFCDLPTMIWNISVMMRVLTLNIDERNKKPIPIFFYFLTGIVAVCYFYVYLVSMLWFVFWRCQETGDLLAALIILALGISSEMGSVKLFCMFLHRTEVRKIVTDCLTQDSLMPPNRRFRNNIMKTLRAVKIRALTFWLVIIGNGIVYIAKAVLLPGRHLMEDLFIIYGLEPIQETPNYQIAFFLNSCGVVFTCYLPANIQAFMIIVSGYIEAQMLALTEELLHLYADAKTERDNTASISIENDTDTDELLNNIIEKQLKEIIKVHARNINIFTEIQHAFSGAIVLEFALLTAALIVELLGGLENTYIDMPFAIMQVGMDCFIGQRVMDASLLFESTVYECHWEKFGKSNMKLVLIMLQNAQKPMQLSAGGMTTLSFSCFMSLVKSVYSAYTALRSTMK